MGDDCRNHTFAPGLLSGRRNALQCCMMQSVFFMCSGLQNPSNNFLKNRLSLSPHVENPEHRDDVGIF